MNGIAGSVFLGFFISLIPITSFVVGYFVMRLRSKERLLAIEKGVSLPQHTLREPREIARSFRIRGMLWAAVAIGMATVFLALTVTVPDFPRAVNAVPVIPALVGAVLLIEYRMRNRELDREEPAITSRATARE